MMWNYLVSGLLAGATVVLYGGDPAFPDLGALRRELSPRHVPGRFVVVGDVPRILNGKKCEVPVKKILAGSGPDRA